MFFKLLCDAEFQDFLVSPSVRVDDVSYISITAEWVGINREVDYWRVTILTDENEVVEVKNKLHLSYLKHVSSHLVVI